MSKLKGEGGFQERKIEGYGGKREGGPTREKGVVPDKQLWLVKRLQCEEEGLFLKGRAA
jgi:hypothetical protein